MEVYFKISVLFFFFFVKPPLTLALTLGQACRICAVGNIKYSDFYPHGGKSERGADVGGSQVDNCQNHELIILFILYTVLFEKETLLSANLICIGLWSVNPPTLVNASMHLTSC